MVPLFLLMSILIPIEFSGIAGGVWATSTSSVVPSQAQIINQKSFNVLSTVLPPSQVNSTAVSDPRLIHVNTSPNVKKIFVWPGVTKDSLKAKPFHIYDDEFYDIIGSNPTLTLIAQTNSDPLFHEAAVWYVLYID